MWGSSFADLAKKAQEASELASKKAQEASSSFSTMTATTDVTQVTSMFNLDKMLENGESADDDTIKIEEEKKIQAEAESRLQAQAQAQADLEASQRLKAEEEEARRRVEEARLRSQREAARLKIEKARIQAEKEAAILKAEEEARRRAEQEAARLRAEKEAAARLKAEEKAARLKAEENARLLAEKEAARLKAEKETARQRAEEEAAKLKAEEEARLKAEEETARLKAEEEAATRRAEEEAARLKSEEEAARLKAEEAARLQAEEEAARLQAEEARLQAEEEAARLKAEEEAARLEAEEVARLRAEEEATRLKAEEEARLQAEEDARLRAEEEARIMAEEQAAILKAEEDARLQAEEEAAKLKAEEEARLQAEEEARVKAKEEAARLRAEEEARICAEEEEAILKVERLKAEEEAAMLQAEEEARTRADEEAARLKAEEEAKIRAEEEAAILRAEEEEEATRLQAEKEAAEQEAAILMAEEEARLRAEEEAAILVAEEEASLRSEDQTQIYIEEELDCIQAETNGDIRGYASETRIEEHRIDFTPLEDHVQKTGLPYITVASGLETDTQANHDFSSYPVDVQDMSQASSQQETEWHNDEIDEMYGDEESSVEDDEEEDMGEDMSDGHVESDYHLGFEPPISLDQQFDNTGDSFNLSMAAGEEDAMKVSMTNTSEIVESDVGDESDLDEMYASSVASSENESQAEPGNVGNNGSLDHSNPMDAIPQFAIEKFMTQLERIHSEHEAELLEMEKKHKLHIDDMKEQLSMASEQSKRAGPSFSDVANHDQCLAQQRQLEKDFNEQLQQREDMIAEISEKNIALKKQVEVLTIEAEGLNNSLIASKERLSEVDSKDEEIEHLKMKLSSTEEELNASNEAYTTLKSRVKSVATELKERRVECRGLNVSVQELTVLKSTLESEKNDLLLKSTRLAKSIEDKDVEIESLTKNVAELRMDAKKKEKALAEKGSMGDKALNVYKKKAQASLSNANARAATANQAREDAEIDAANAREEANAALKAAKDAELDKEVAIREAHEEQQIFLDQIDDLKKELSKIQNEVSSYKDTTDKALKESENVKQQREELLVEWDAKVEEVQKADDRISTLEQDIAMARIKSKEQENELQILRDELEERASAAFMARQNNDKEKGNENDSKTSGNATGDKATESDGTIVMLQQELKVANDAIKDLKEALANAISNNNYPITDPNKPSNGVYGPGISELSRPSSPSSGKNNSDTTPLFFAFEKQAELNTARDEITRLAALLGDAESAKMEAQDAMENMRKKMEEAEARLRRNEKLGPANGARLTGSSSSFHAHHGYNNRRNMVMGAGHPMTFNTNETSMSSHSDSTVNLEYLKNIMLRYLNATTLNEKKALVPVVGACLELTADELTSAMDNIEKSAGINGVGTSLIENVQNKGLVGGLFG